MRIDGTAGWNCDIAYFKVDLWRACSYAFHMSVMVQIRNVPTELHQRLKARAALAGMTLSDYWASLSVSWTLF